MIHISIHETLGRRADGPAGRTTSKSLSQTNVECVENMVLLPQTILWHP